jgi:DNA-binding winged helix-turn-helix (wHTH) protein
LYPICKQLVQKEYPEELMYFDVIWEVMGEYLYKWEEKSPEEWPINKSRERVLSNLGFADPAEMPDITAPKMIAVIAAVLWHMRSIEFVPEENDLERIIKDYSTFFRLPFSLELDANIKQLLIPLCKEEASKFIKRLEKEEIRTEIIERGKLIKYREDKINELKKKKDEYDIWICKAYRRSEDEIIIDKIKTDIRDQPLRLLIFLLKSTGRLCGYPEIFQEVWGESKRNSKSFERRKIVQAWRDLKKNEFLNNNIEVIRGKGFLVKDGLRNHCIIYSTQLFS